MNIQQYYKSNHAYEFLISSNNLIEKSTISTILSKYDFLSERNKDNTHKKLHDFRMYIADELDEINFLMIRCSVAIELSLKGISVSKGYNIFKFNDRKFLRYNKINANSLIDKQKTYELQFYIDNLDKLIGKNNSKKYKRMIIFFKEQRNDYIHFARKQYDKNSIKILNNLKLLLVYFKKVVDPFKNKHSMKEAKLEDK